MGKKLGSRQHGGSKQTGDAPGLRQIWTVAKSTRGTGRQVVTQIQRADPESSDGSEQAWVGKQQLMAQRKSVELSNTALRAAMLRSKVAHSA